MKLRWLTGIASDLLSGVASEVCASVARRAGFELVLAGQLQSLRDEMADDERYYTTDLANYKRVIVNAKRALERVAIATDGHTAKVQAERAIVEIGSFLGFVEDECPFGDEVEEQPEGVDA